MNEQNAHELEEFARKRGLSVEEIRKHLHHVGAHAEANAEPLPGPLALAFPAKSITVHGVRVRPFVAYDRILLRAINSPLHRQLLELGKPVAERQATPFNELEGFEIIWLFTHTCEDAAITLGMDLFDPMGADGVSADTLLAFRKKCVREIGLVMDPTVAGMVSAAIGEQIGNSIATALQYGKEQENEGAIFSLPPPELMTASRGGSPTSAGSSATTHS